MSTATEQSPPQETQRPYEQFIRFVRGKIAEDAGVKARLRRSIRSDGDITSDALWIIGGWLPVSKKEQGRALTMARTAAWCAKYHLPMVRQDGSWHQKTVAGQLADQSVNEHTAQRLLELMTRDGMEVANRLNHVGRALEICPYPERIDWAQLISDLNGLLTGGDRALAVRIRWYRAYHRMSGVETISKQQGETPEKDDNNDQ